MIESSVNGIGLLAEGMLVILTALKVIRRKGRAWEMLLLFYAALFCGNVYWTLYLIFYGMTPKYFYVSEFVWYAGYLFLLLLVNLVKRGSSSRRFPILYLIPPFAAGCGLFFILKGSAVIDNIVTETLMGLVMWNALEGFLLLRDAPEEERNTRCFFIVVFVFGLVEHAMWIASCFWMGDTLKNPYFWIELVQIVCLALMFPALRKAVGE